MSADLLAVGSPAPAPEREWTARLRAVETPQPARRPRLLYGLVAVAVAILIGATQMGLSVLTTQTSYDIATLTQEHRALDWQQQILEDQVAGLSSPQYLAANASALGMVVGQPPSYLRLSDRAIIGDSAGATGVTSIDALTKAAVPNALIGGVPLVTDPASSLSSGATVETVALAADSPTPPAIADGLPTPDTH
ncbi:hypothetical protein [Microbacterium sp.]|uniref:hypothetical protein n=1 Tax=Microbacterium sp. TaxID=51671 RepID=UPI0025DDCFE2|nr:hypothetical protein [Microbacterium sp.]